MHDPVLDQRLENCRLLLKLWQQFRLFFTACNDEARQFTPQEEAQFLKIKSEIAIQYDSFFESIQSNDRETLATVQSVLTLVQACILLRQVQHLNVAERRKMEIEWHEAYLLINATIGLLEDEQATLAAISETTFKRQQVQKKIVVIISRLAHNRGLHITLGVVAVLVALVVLPMMGVFSYDMLDNYPSTRGVYRFACGQLRNAGIALEYKDMESVRATSMPKKPDGYAAPDPKYGEQSKSMSEAFVKKVLAAVDKEKPVQLGTESKGYDATKGSGACTITLILFKNSAMAKTICPGSRIEGAELVTKYGLREDEGKRYIVRRKANLITIMVATTELVFQNFLDAN